MKSILYICLPGLCKIPDSSELFRPVKNNFSSFDVLTSTSPSDKMVFYSSEISSDRIEVLHRPGIFAGSIVGGLIGAKIDNGNILGFWSLIMGGVGSLFGIWIGYIINKNYF